MRYFAFLAVFALSMGALPEQVVSADSSADIDAVRAAVKSYVEAFNRADASAVADHWAEDAEYVLPTGERVQGRPAILKVFKKLFAEKPTPKLEVIKADVRLLGGETALEEGVARVTNSDGEVEDSSYLAVHVRQGKAWKLNTVRETNLPAAPPSAPNAQYEHLKDLEWLVGIWIEESGNGDSLSQFDWSKNQKFIKGQFKLPMPDGEPMEGTQIIGWDPESGVIRSWMFNSEGGFGEGLWTRNGNTWSVKFVQVMADGRRASSTNFYTMTDENSFEWKTIGRKIDSQFGPNIGPVKVVRVREKQPEKNKDAPSKEGTAAEDKAKK